MTDQDAIDLALRIIKDVEVGSLTTISPDGEPFARYVGAAIDNGRIHWLYALSSRRTRKIEHIDANPAVCWLFADDNYEHVATLRGSATVKPTTDLPMGPWTTLIDHARHYAMDATTDPQHHQFDAILTRVEHLEVLSPSQGIYHPHTITIDH